MSLTSPVEVDGLGAVVETAEEERTAAMTTREAEAEAEEEAAVCTQPSPSKK